MPAPAGVAAPSLAFALAVCVIRHPGVAPADEAWPLHVVDGSSRGADGVKLADFDGDGHLDVATGWEEGGIVRIYRNPGPAAAADPWPRIEVGEAPDVEDAVLVDLDGDGTREVVACCEGRTREVFVYWQQADGGYERHGLPAVRGQQWMFAQPLQIDGEHGSDLVVGSKNEGGSLGWLQAPADPRDAAAWIYHPLTEAGWIMSIWFRDLDGDGRQDVVYSDRRGPRRGVWMLSQPEDPLQDWTAVRLWTSDADIMSFDFGDLDADGLEDLTVAVEDHRVVWLRRTTEEEVTFEAHEISADHDCGNTRAAEPGDLDGDGDLDIAVTTWRAEGLQGVLWLENDGSPLDGGWKPRTLSGSKHGIKYDHSELLDLDADGDLDLLTCEEREGKRGLGVIWYENPAR